MKFYEPSVLLCIVVVTDLDPGPSVTDVVVFVFVLPSVSSTVVFLLLNCVLLLRATVVESLGLSGGYLSNALRRWALASDRSFTMSSWMAFCCMAIFLSCSSVGDRVQMSPVHTVSLIPREYSPWG